MKRFLAILGVISLILIGWFLFIKEYDYQFHFNAKYGQGVLFYEVSNWKHLDPDSPNEDIQITAKEDFSSITQNLVLENDSTVKFHWEFEKETDSLTQATLFIKASKNKLKNRLDILNPFSSSVFVDSIKGKLLQFKRNLDDRQENYEVKVEEDLVKSPEMTCICHQSKGILLEKKAFEMLRTISYLEKYVVEHELNLTGKPFIKITSWDRDENVIDFDFCFPVNLAQDIRPDEHVDFREMKTFPALKAIYRGNYRDSHLAWFELLNEAQSANLQTNELPLEVFYQNPRTGEDSRTWRTDVYLPVKP